MILGTAGHVDHGKTTLVAALTGVDCDRLDEEKRRGITISLGFAPWDLPGGTRISVVDVPGHERLVHTMLVGAAGMEAALLVVSAEAGVMPQTREHLGALRVLGIRRGVVAVTFADSAPDIRAAAAAVRQDLRGSPLEGAPVLPVCAPTREGLDALTRAVDALARESDAPPRDLPPLLPVDRVFSVPGFGTVVTGSLLRGHLTVGDIVALHPGYPRLRVRGLQVHGNAVRVAEPGQRVALNLPELPRGIGPGGFVAPPDALVETRLLDAEVEWLPHLEAPLKRRRGVGFHLGATIALAEVRADTPIEPGQRGTARIRLDRPLVVPPGARFVLRGAVDSDFGRVVGGGRVLDARPPRRRDAARRARLAIDPTDVVAVVAEAGPRGLAPEELHRRLPVVARAPGPTVFDPAVVEGAAAELIASVRAWHERHPLDPGMPVARAGHGALASRALALALEADALARRGDRLADPAHEVALDAADQNLAQKLLRAIGRAGYQGPAEKDLLKRFPASDERIRAVLEHLERAGRVVRTHGLCFPGRELRHLRRDAARAALAGRVLDVAWLKERAGVTRKHAIPLFGWLDETGATLRQENVRIAGPRAAEWAEDAEG